MKYFFVELLDLNLVLPFNGCLLISFSSDTYKEYLYLGDIIKQYFYRRRCLWQLKTHSTDKGVLSQSQEA